MATYLATGIVQKMHIKKREIAGKNVRVEHIIKSLKNQLNIDNYFFGQNEDEIFWEIKPEMFQENFAEFLEVQFKMYNDKNDVNVQQVIDKIKEAKTGEGIIELAEAKIFSEFQMLNHICEPLEVWYKESFSTYLSVYYHLVAFFIDGKIIMECYRNIFRYFEMNIRLQKEKYPIVTCLKIMING